ncbi:MAG: hypothetical protein EZS28_038125 [Streblomastix strix]|uniref:Uncharacterized protein n=1 Tax=Streblomastix strix TaxID=222440 RepID=A0A5J4U7R6_9EUKA|nr:MAG: hypothetical protein EZS28_038125 [Streblomastix strix]
MSVVSNHSGETFDQKDNQSYNCSIKSDYGQTQSYASYQQSQYKENSEYNPSVYSQSVKDGSVYSQSVKEGDKSYDGTVRSDYGQTQSYASYQPSQYKEQKEYNPSVYSQSVKDGSVYQQSVKEGSVYSQSAKEGDKSYDGTVRSDYGQTQSYASYQPSQYKEQKEYNPSVYSQSVKDGSVYQQSVKEGSVYSQSAKEGDKSYDGTVRSDYGQTQSYASYQPSQYKEKQEYNPSVYSQSVKDGSVYSQSIKNQSIHSSQLENTEFQKGIVRFTSIAVRDLLKNNTNGTTSSSSLTDQEQTLPSLTDQEYTLGLYSLFSLYYDC